jgi:tetratricopeptide (TPR) repeat protein
MSILEQASTLARSGDLAGAIELLDSAELEGHDRVNAFGMKGSMLSQLGDHLAAARAYLAVIDLVPGHPMAWYSLGCSLRELGNHERALSAFERATELNPSDPDGWINRGVMHDELAQHDDAIACYDRALVLDDNDPMTWSNRGNSHASLGKFAEARRCYERSLELADDPRVWRSNIRTLVWDGRIADANQARRARPADDHDGEAREQRKDGLVARYFIARHSHPQMLDHAVARMLELAAECRTRPPGVKDGTRIQYGWTVITLRARGSELVLCEPDFARDPQLHVREDVSFTAMSTVQWIASQALVRDLPDGPQTTYLDLVRATPGALASPNVTLARTADDWELRAAGDDAEASDELPLYHFARERPHLLKAIWLPAGWTAVFEDHRLTSVLDERGRPRMS